MKDFHWENEDEEDEEEEIETIPEPDPIYELPVEETLKLGYEWVVEEDSRPSVRETWTRGSDFFKYGGYRAIIRRDSTLFEPTEGSPIQSNVDFIRSSYMQSAAIPHYNRAFDFSKTLREVGRVDPTFGGQSPHWIGTPQFSLATQVETQLQVRPPSFIESDYTLASSEVPEVAVDRRPSSPESCVREESSEESYIPTRYSIFTDGLNPWNLVGQDFEEAEPDPPVDSEEKVDLLALSAKERAMISFNKSRSSEVMSDYEETPPTSREGQSFGSTHQQDGDDLYFPTTPYSVMADYEETPNSSRERQLRKDQPSAEYLYAPTKYHAEIPQHDDSAESSRFRQQYAPQQRIHAPTNPFDVLEKKHDDSAESSRSRQQYGTQQKPYASTIPYDDSPYRNLSTQGRYIGEAEKEQQRPGVHQKPPASGGMGRSNLEDVISRQIAETQKQLHSAYDHLEQSEMEKRRLVQQLSYLRLMELDLEELQAINRIIAAEVPAEEDIEILDRIIAKIKGPRIKHTL